MYRIAILILLGISSKAKRLGGLKWLQNTLPIKLLFGFVAEAGAIAKSRSIFTNYYARLDYAKIKLDWTKIGKNCPH